MTPTHNFMTKTVAGVVRVSLGMAYVLAAMTACSSDGVAPPTHSTAATVATLQLSPLNAVMAVGDTLSLRVTGRTLTGASITQFDSVEYIYPNLGDSLIIGVSPSGVMTAKTVSGINSPVKIQVVAFKDGLARAEQAVIQVTQAKFTGATLSIQPVPPDSAILDINDTKYITPVIQNPGTGESVDFPTVRFEYGPGDSSKVFCYQPNFVETGTLTSSQLNLTGCGGVTLLGEQLNAFEGQGPGQVWLIAAVNVYGVPLRDSVRYTITNPTTRMLSLQFYGLDLTVGDASLSSYLRPGGTVTFYNATSPKVNVVATWTFDNPAAATAADPPSNNGGETGNVVGLTSYQQATRRFMTAGTYTYTVTATGSAPPYTTKSFTGQIIVQ